MAELILGTQGSGKTLFAVKKIVDDTDKYDAIFTNIADFKYKKNPKYKELLPSNFFSKIISVLYNRYRENNNISDVELKKIFYGLLNIDYNEKGRILIIIDEAHNFLGKRDDVVQWFSTYHRHLNVDYYLITQLLTSISVDNRIFNNIYEAYPVSRQFLPNRLRYKHYFALPLVQGNLNESFSIKKEQKYFDMYHSGDILKADKKGIMFKLLLLFFLLLLIIFGFQYFLGSFGSSSSSPSSSSSSSSPSSFSSVVSSSEIEKTDDNHKIFTYFVDLEKKELYCNDDLKVIPLALLPNPIYFSSDGLSFVTYFYSFPLLACFSQKDSSASNNDVIDYSRN